MDDDPAYAAPLPAEQYLDEAARLAGFADWFAVPSFFRTPVNRHVIVNARLLEKRAALAQHRRGS